MTTGDLANNIRKMGASLKNIQFSGEIDVKEIEEGSPKVYLPIYHYAFTSYSPALAELILSKDIELYGKSDQRFMESIYKVLRDVFAYKPPVNKDQFFGKGFVERKVIMCTEIVELVRKKNRQLNPAAAKKNSKMGVRPKSANPGLSNLSVPRSRTSVAGKISPRGQEKKADHKTPHVVNELIVEPVPEPVRHVAQSVNHVEPVRHMAPSAHHAVRHTSPRFGDDRPAVREPVKHVAISSSPQIRTYTPEKSFSPDRFTTNQEIFNTPSIKKVCSQSVEVVSIPRRDDTLEPSILEINAPTSDSVLHGPVASQQSEVLNRVSDLYQTVQTLTNLVYNLNTQLNNVKDRQLENSGSVPKADVEKKIETIQSQISNLAARMTLMENRISIIESKADQLSGVTPQVKSQSRPVNLSNYSSTATSLRVSDNTLGSAATERDVSGGLPVTETETELPECSSALFSGPGSSFAEELKAMSTNQKVFSPEKCEDFSLNYSPIRKVVNGVAGQLMSANEDTFAMETEDDARRSSTPTGGMMEESSLHCQFTDTDTKDVASRINNMLKATMKMMKEPTTSSPNDTLPKKAT